MRGSGTVDRRIRRSENVVSWKPGGNDVLRRERPAMYKVVERSSNKKSLDLAT